MNSALKSAVPAMAARTIFASMLIAMSLSAAPAAVAKGAPEPAAATSSSTAYMTRTVTTWMLAYEASHFGNRPAIAHVEDLASEKECEAVWKEMLELVDVPADKKNRKHKSIRVEKRAR